MSGPCDIVRNLVNPAKDSHLWEMAMRIVKPGVGALVVLLFLVFCADSEAGRRCRRQQCCNDYCVIPCWVRWIERGSHETFICPAGYDCYCCSGVNTIPCGSGECDSGIYCCVKHGSPYTINCGVLAAQRSAFQSSTTSVERLYAMVCDPCWRVWRFALPCECPDAWGPLCMLGTQCMSCSN